MKLRFTQQAIDDLSSIGDYIRQRNPQAALRVRTAILESLQTLLLFPHVGRRQKVSGVRKLLTRRYPYLVYYTTDDTAGEVIVLSIQHPARERDLVDD